MEVRAVDADVDLSAATLIIGVMESMAPVPGSESVWEGVDLAVVEAAGFEGKAGQVATLPHPQSRALLLVGLGAEVSYVSLRRASGDAVRVVRTERAVTTLALAGIEGAARAVTEGSHLGAYQYRAYKTDDEALKVSQVDVIGAAEEEVANASVFSGATALARDWVNTPAKDLSPAAFAQVIESVAGGAGLKVEVWDKPRIETERLGAVLGVAAGSDREPRVVIVEHRHEDADRHIVMVGKGITFDSGGLSVKPAASMEEMKDDMAGAAAVIAATVGIANLDLPVNVTAITPLTDNAIGGDATRPGDVLRPVSGPTIEVLNTDAEGRLILADGLGLAQRYKPDLIVDVATLTGAVSVALGKRIAAVFAKDSDVSDQLLDAAARAGEELWELPLFEGYRKSIDSNIADIKNISGTRYGGAIVAALFLAEYAGDGPWAHLDIAGPARSEDTVGELVKGASGFGVRTLIELARHHAFGTTDNGRSSLG